MTFPILFSSLFHRDRNNHCFIVGPQLVTRILISLRFYFWKNFLHCISKLDTRQKISSSGDTEQKISSIEVGEQRFNLKGRGGVMVFCTDLKFFLNSWTHFYFFSIAIKLNFFFLPSQNRMFFSTLCIKVWYSIHF